MNILYYHYTSSKDGQYIHISSIVSALRSLGHYVRLVGPALPGKIDFGKSDRIIPTLKRSMPKSLYEILELTYGLIDLFRLLFICIREQPDFIYYRYNIYSPAIIIAGYLLSIAVIMEVNAPLAEERSEFGGLKMRLLARWLEKMQWRSADHIFTVSETLSEYLQRQGVSTDRLTVLPNAIDLDRFQPIPDPRQVKASLGIEAFRVVGFVGFMREWHGLEQLLDWIATSAPADVILLFVGDGPARQGLEQRALDLGVDRRVTITGVVDQKAIPNYLAAFDIAVLPSAVRYASPLKILEYMAAARAIVAPNQPNIRELLENNHTAMLFPNGNISEVIDNLINDKNLRLALGANARANIIEKRMTWNGNAEKILSIAKKITYLKASKSCGGRTALYLWCILSVIFGNG